MRLASLALAAVIALGLAGCSQGGPAPDAGSRSEAASDDPSSKILQPGRPGEGNETLDPDTTVEQAPWNDDDARFMQMMVVHHAQALEMSELAQTRARNEQVVSLARRIKGAQGPEILAMASWLQGRGLEVPETMADLGDGAAHGGHGEHGGHAAMPGMLTQRQLDRLAAARGAEFDRLFLAGMIEHHRGAVEMAGAVMESGSDTLVLELAADIATGQLAEIQRMQDVRRSL